jgi:hypothetical protein
MADLLAAVGGGRSTARPVGVVRVARRLEDHEQPGTARRHVAKGVRQRALEQQAVAGASR